MSWDVTLKSVAGFVGVEAGSLLSPRLRGEAEGYSFSDSFDVHILHNVDPDLVARAAAEVSSGELVDPLGEAMAASVGGDFSRVAVARRTIDFETIRGTPYWNEYCLPAGIGDVASLVLDMPRDQAWPVISLYKRPGTAPFLDEEIRRFSILAPHLQRAARLARRQAALSTPRRGLGVGIEALRVGCLLFNGQGRVLHANRAARLGLEAAGLELRVGELEAKDRATDRRLKAVILAAVRSAGPAARSGGEVPMKGSRGATVLSIYPLAQANIFGAQGLAARAIGYFVAPDPGRAAGAIARVRRLFALTEAEAAILAELLAGAAPAGIAGARGRSIETVRTQIKRILGKTDSKGIHELLALTSRYESPGE